MKDLGLWRYNKRTGYWDRVRSVSPETKDEWLAIWKKDEPESEFKVSQNRPSNPPRWV